MAETGFVGIVGLSRLAGSAAALATTNNANYSIRIGAARRAAQAVITLCDSDATRRPDVTG
jgi:hypothetical protein